METLAFDARMGASGDMILGALIDAGADPAVLEPIEESLPITYRIRETSKCDITATSVDVVLTDRDGVSHGGGSDHRDNHGHTRDHGHDHGHDPDNNHDHDHGHGHGHEHGHANDDPHDHDHTHDNGHDHGHGAEGHGPHRSYLEVRSIIEGMDLEDGIERDSLAVVERLGEAEASVHGIDLEEIHFHEVGADDAIADIVGAITLLADIAPDRVVTTPLATGGGSVQMSHGEYPVPTPAVLEIAERANWSIRGGPVNAELLTPTGAAILASVADGIDSLPALCVDDVGYGAGSHDFDPHPNVLRVIRGSSDADLVKDDIAVLETNLDDATPEILGSLQETLVEAGARDVTIIPATMKKSRPGHLVKVVCKPGERAEVARRLAEETGTLGVRETGVQHRWIADREIRSVELEIDGNPYQVDVKISSDVSGTVYDVSPEYDDALSVAVETGLPVREIMDRANARLTADQKTE